MAKNWTTYWTGLLEQELRARNYSKETFKNYIHAVGIFLDPHPKHPAELTQNDVRLFLNTLRIENQFSASTVNLYRDGLAFFFHHIVKNPSAIDGLPRLKEDKALPDVLDANALTRMMASVQNPKHHLALALSYGCGFRVGELAALKVADIQFTRKTITVRKGKGSKDRLVMLPESLETPIQNYLDQYNPRTYLFESSIPGTPLTKRTFQMVFKNACKAAGIIQVGGIHSLRHSFATHLLENGTDIRYIQSLMGHSSSKTTERYTHVASHQVGRIKSPVDLLGR